MSLSLEIKGESLSLLGGTYNLVVGVEMVGKSRTSDRRRWRGGGRRQRRKEGGRRPRSLFFQAQLRSYRPFLVYVSPFFRVEGL